MSETAAPFNQDIIWSGPLDGSRYTPKDDGPKDPKEPLGTPKHLKIIHPEPSIERHEAW